jgi:hypothetical protein
MDGGDARFTHFRQYVTHYTSYSKNLGRSRRINRMFGFAYAPDILDAGAQRRSPTAELSKHGPLGRAMGDRPLRNTKLPPRTTSSS